MKPNKITGTEKCSVWSKIEANRRDKSKSKPLVYQGPLVFSSPYQSIYKVSADFFDFTKEYFVNEFGTRVGLVVDRQGYILLTRQYRLLIDDISWEIPGGGLDEGETAVQAAVRECLEETGVHCLNPQPLIFYHTGLDVVYSPTHLFYTNQIEEKYEQDKINSQEVSGSEWVPMEKCIDMIFGKQIVDSFSITALLVYHTIKIRQAHSTGNVPG